MTTTARPRSVGTARTRIEGRDKVTGAARYAGEHRFDQLVHAWLVLSPIARGRIRSVGEREALAMPGVLAVLHHGNAPQLTTDYVSQLGTPYPGCFVFQDDRIRHAGWPVALVVAETPEQAREAAETLAVEYDEEPHDTDFRPGRDDAYVPDNGAVEKGTDPDAELAASAAVVDAEYTTPEEHHTAMEPHSVTCRWDDGRLDVHDSNQGSGMVADEIAKMFSLDPASVRVRADHVGGAFGSKGVRAHQAAAIMAATQLQRPVRLALTRRQVFALTGFRSPTAQRVRLGADADGRLRVLDHTALNATSTEGEFVEQSADFGRMMYPADAHRTVHRLLALDVPHPTWMRAPGEAPGSFALESAVDELAEKLAMDPIALRLRNDTAVGPISGKPFAGRNLAGCFEEGARRFGWAERDPRPRIRRDGRWLVGTGTAAARFSAFAVPSTAAVTAEADGTFTVRVNAADVGTGARTALTLVAADALDTDLDRVRISIADSDFGPAWLAGGSAGTRSWSWAVMAAADELRTLLAGHPDIPPEGLTATGNSAAAIGALDQVERQSFGAQFAEVAVDPLSGEVRVRRMLGMFAAGRIVNPLTARSQLTGGMVWGISMALHEEAARDERTGGNVGADFAGYHVAANADIGTVEADWVDDPMPGDPTGIKGVGEVGIVGVAAAVANAVWHATGVRYRDLPLRPDRVLAGEAAREG